MSAVTAVHYSATRVSHELENMTKEETHHGSRVTRGWQQNSGRKRDCHSSSRRRGDIQTERQERGCVAAAATMAVLAAAAAPAAGG